MLHRIMFMGSPDFAVPTLERLCAESDLCEVVCVVTQPDKPTGRGRKLSPPPVKMLATQRNIPVLQPKGLKKHEVTEQLRSYAPDLMVVAAYGKILPQAVLDLPKLGCVNVHASLLPKHRGASPIAHAILHGDQETGISIMQMDAGMDTGPIWTTSSLRIPKDATTESLSESLAILGADTLAKFLPELLFGSCEPTQQNHECATYAPKLEKQHGKMDLTKPAKDLERQVRAFFPWPGCVLFKMETSGEPSTQGLNVLEAQVEVVEGSGVVNSKAPGTAIPGQVLEAGRKGIVVACGKQGLRLLQVKPAGRKPMPASAFVAGRGVEKGDQFWVP